MDAESTRTRTLSFPILLIGFGSVAIILAQSLPDFIQRGIQLPGPKLFPVVLGVFLVIAGIVELIQWFIAFSRGAVTSFPREGIGNVAAFLGAMVLFVIVLPTLGFQVSGLLFGTVVLRALGVQWIKAMLTSFFLVAIITLLFGVAFRVPLPWGMLSFLR